MSKLTAIKDWLSECPALSNLFVITAEGLNGDNLITPFGSSGRADIDDRRDIYDTYCADIIPRASVYEEYQIDCFRYANPNENEYNILTYEQVEEACRWIETQNLSRNYPAIGEKIIRVEPQPFLPQVRFKDVETNRVAYMFTLRIHYVNDMQRAYTEYE